MYIINKRRLIALAVALAFAVVAISAAGITEATLTSADGEAAPQIIIIDAGHGGVDGGAVGVNGTVEKRINLEISLLLRDVLTDAGHTVIMTRDTDISIHDSTAKTIREMKVSDLHNRLAITELYPNSLLVSIHQNTLGNSSVKGAQVFFSPNDPESKMLAECIQSSFNARLQPDNEKTTKQAGKNLYLFYNAKNRAVLAECGFLSNPTEEKMLCSEEYQQKIVYVIYCGITEYLAAQA